MNETSTATTVLTVPLVIVVDDDPSVLDALTALLTPRLEPSYRVETASSAEEALDLLASYKDPARPAPVALVISDERMPGKSGTDLLVALRQHPAHRHGGRIIVTGYAGLASAQRAINEAEVDRYYPKPWDAEKALLPAVDDILTRFAKLHGLDRYLECALATGPYDMTLLREARKGWWEYLNLMGESSAEGGDGEEPTWDDPEDEGAFLFLARRVTPSETRPAGTIRLHRAGGAWTLDGLAFQPEEAGDEVETLMLRTALLHAASEKIETVRTHAPTLRREVYEAVGFATAPEPTDPGPPGTVVLAARPAARVASDAAHARRFEGSQRLCACAQTACPERDYAAPRRGYFCPLDRR